MDSRLVNLELRPVGDGEYAAFTRVDHAAFGHQPTAEEIEDWRPVFEADRSLAVFDGPDIVATTGGFAFDLTLPGGTATPAAGVTSVGVLPTHRRRGILTAMMDRHLDDVAGRGEAVAILTASETAIYGRFGYGTASAASAWRLETRGTTLAHPPAGGGTLRLVDPREAATVLPAVYDRARLRRPGAVSRPPAYWDHWLLDREGWRDGASARFYVVHRSPDGEPDGYAAYRIKERWERGLSQGELIVGELEAADDDAEAALWRYLIDVDLVATVVAGGRPVDEPLRWRLADPRRLSVTQSGDDLWLRLVDVPAALAARRYGTDDRLLLDVDDAFRPASAGRYAVEGGPDGATCARVDAGADEPDLALTVADLGALYLGGVQATVLARAGRCRQRTPGALRRADAFFASSPPPWCGTDF